MASTLPHALSSCAESITLAHAPVQRTPQKVMKAGPRSRAPAPTSAPSSATACRSVGRRSHGNPSPDHPEPLGSLGAVGVTLAHEGAAGEETARLGVSEGMRTGKAACSNPWVGSDEHLQERAQPLEDDLQANVGESQVEHACMPGGRETRVYHGSVRSGQQVSPAALRCIGVRYQDAECRRRCGNIGLVIRTWRS